MIRNFIIAECIYALYPILILLCYPFFIVISVVVAIRKCLSIWLPQKSVKGEVALITGSGQGLGRLIAIELAKRGCHVAIVDVQGDSAEETAKYIRELCDVQAKSYKIDVANYKQLEQLQIQITKDLGDVTILINNAAILTLSSIDSPPAEEIQRMINVNLNAVVYATQIFLPKMKQLNRGHIVNVSSMAALMPFYLFNVYGATKSAVRHLTASLRTELVQKNCNITATVVMPTFLNTSEHAERFVNSIKGDKFIPPIDGQIVVQHLVRGMLNGDGEITVPRVFLFFYKFKEFLPAYIFEKIIAVGTQEMMAIAYSDRCSKILMESKISQS